MATKNGVVKKTSLIEFAHVRKNGIFAIVLEEGDELIGARLTQATEEVFLVSEKGMCVRFTQDQIRSMGRVTRGVRGMRLKGDDHVVAMVDGSDGDDLLCVSVLGFGKQTPLAEYRKTNRGGIGVKTMNISDKSGPIVAARMLKPDDELLIVTREGIIIRLTTREIPHGSRTRGGVKLIRLSAGDSVTSMAVLR
jgi:DNA gyrase subunit A